MAKRLEGKKERKLLRKVSLELQLQKQRELAQRRAKRIKSLRGIKKLVTIRKGIKKRRGSISRRDVGTRKLLTATGVLQKRKVGRPSGTYKYQMPISEWKRKQSQQKSLYELYRREQLMRLRKRGISPEELQRLQYERTIEQPVQPSRSIADDELQFRTWMAKKTLSPNTQRILVNLRRTQLKAKSDDVEMQRRLKERRVVGSAGSLLKTPFVFKDHQLDVTGVNDENILKAENVFRENPENPNVLRTQRLNILQTRAAGNDLGFV